MTDSSNGKLPDYLIDQLRGMLSDEQRNELLLRVKDDGSVSDWIGRIDLQSILRKVEGDNSSVFHFIGSKGTIKVPSEILLTPQINTFRRYIFTATGLLPADKPSVTFLHAVTLVAVTELGETETSILEDYLEAFHRRTKWVETEKEAIEDIKSTNKRGTYDYQLATVISTKQPYFRLPALQSFMKEAGGKYRDQELAAMLRELGYVDVRRGTTGRHWKGPEGAVGFDPAEGEAVSQGAGQ